MSLHCTLKMHGAQVSTLRVSTAGSQCTCQLTFSVEFKCSILSAHPVCKCNALGTAFSDCECKVCCWITWCIRGLHRACTTCAISVLLCGRIAELFKSSAAFRSEKPPWNVAVQSNLWCATAATYRASSDTRNHQLRL